MQTDRQTNRHTDRERQTDRQTNRQTNPRIVRLSDRHRQELNAEFASWWPQTCDSCANCAVGAVLTIDREGGWEREKESL